MTYHELAQMIDQQPCEVTRWEADFLHSILRNGPRSRLTPAQQGTLRQLGEKHLPHHVMVEFHGQLTLL